LRMHVNLQFSERSGMSIGEPKSGPASYTSITGVAPRVSCVQ
jgi:hypothetical protein